jgi:membrane protein required for colicin V production
MVFDILFVIFIGVGFWWGYQKGIIYSIFSLLSYFLGIIGALKFSFIAVKFLNGTLNLGPKGIAITAFILVFILVVLLVRLVAWALEQILKSFSLNITNQLIGGTIHALIGLYVFCVFIWFLNKWDVFPKELKTTSHVYPYISDLGPQVVEYTGKIVPIFKDTFQNFEDMIKTSYHKPE